MVEVTKADREAAASVAVLTEMRGLIRAGKADHHAEAFARHRIAAAQAERAAAAGAMKGPLAWLERWARHIGDCPGNIGCTCGLSFARMELRTAIEAGEHRA